MSDCVPGAVPLLKAVFPIHVAQLWYSFNSKEPNPIMDGLVVAALCQDFRSDISKFSQSISVTSTASGSYTGYLETISVNGMLYDDYWRAPVQSISSLKSGGIFKGEAKAGRALGSVAQVRLLAHDIYSYDSDGISGVRLVYRVGVGVMAVTTGWSARVHFSVSGSLGKDAFVREIEGTANRVHQNFKYNFSQHLTEF